MSTGFAVIQSLHLCNVSNLRICFDFQLRTFKVGFSGPKTFRAFRETGPWTMLMTLRSFLLQTKLERLGSNSEGTGLRINNDKTKMLRFNARKQDPIKIISTEVKDTDSFVYLGTIVNNLVALKETSGIG